MPQVKSSSVQWQYIYKVGQKRGWHIVFKWNQRRRKACGGPAGSGPSCVSLNLQINKCCLWSRPREADEQQLRPTSNVWLPLKQQLVKSSARLWTHSTVRVQDSWEETEKKEMPREHKQWNIYQSEEVQHLLRCLGRLLMQVLLLWFPKLPLLADDELLCFRFEQTKKNKHVPYWHHTYAFCHSKKLFFLLLCSSTCIYYNTLFIPAPDVFPIGSPFW